MRVLGLVTRLPQRCRDVGASVGVSVGTDFGGPEIKWTMVDSRDGLAVVDGGKEAVARGRGARRGWRDHVYHNIRVINDLAHGRR